MDGIGERASRVSSIPRTALALGAALLGSGCDLSDAPVLDPKGPIALAERDLLFTAVVLMLIVVVPVFAMTFLFAWRYRASNTQRPLHAGLGLFRRGRCRRLAGSGR